MGYRRCFILVAWAFTSAASAASLDSPLLDRLERAKNGDFTVLEAGKTITLLAVRAKTERSLVIEEISAPADVVVKKNGTWGEWVKTHAPGHTSWSMMEIDLKTREIVECYSFSKSAWISLHKEHFLLGLLQLPLTPVAANQRRRIGPLPQEGEADRRGIWNPPLMIDGKKLDHALFDVFQALWPQDGSELGGQTVSLYFDVGRQSLVPSWIQVDTAHATASMRAIDSGKNLPAVHRTLPRRVPHFVGTPVKTESGIRLSLKSPKYYRAFELFAVDITDKDKQLYSVSHALVLEGDDLVSLEVSAEELDQILLPDRKYTWLVVPTGHSESYIEGPKPFTWGPR